VETPLFLFLGGSAGVVAATGVAAAAPPTISVARADASVAHVTSLVGCLAAGAPVPAPGVVSSAANTALGEGGEGSHLSGGAQPPSLSSSSSPDDEYSSVLGEESPCCPRSWNSSLLRSRRSRRRMLRSLLRAARSCSRRYAARSCARDRGVGGLERATFTALICKERANLQDTLTSREPAERGKEEVHSPMGRRGHGERQRATSSLLTPKFGKESDLWVRFDKESVWWKKGYFQRYSAKDLRSAICSGSAKEQ
jgi:hypothetical protein